MSEDLSLKQMQKEWHGTVKSYVIGFFSSLILTSLAFYLVIVEAFSKQNLIFVLVGLSLVQATVQLLFFLHLGEESKPRWESVVFWFMIIILLIVVLGTLWIMYDLNNRMMMRM